MLEESVGLAAVTILAILEQAYFCLQVIQARRKFGVPPPATSGPAEFQRVFRAQANSSEYFPIFISALWLSGIFFSQGLSSACGLLYLGGRLAYFRGYSQSPEQRKRTCCRTPARREGSRRKEGRAPERNRSSHRAGAEAAAGGRRRARTSACRPRRAPLGAESVQELGSGAGPPPTAQPVAWFWP